MRVIRGGMANEAAGSDSLSQDLRNGENPIAASLDLTPTFGDVEANLRLAEASIRAAKLSHPTLRWVVLPELFTSGYSDLGSVHRYAEDASSGRSVLFMSDLAHELDLYIAYGFPESLPSGGIATSANLIGPGAFATYRKRHLVETTLEHAVFTPGTEIPVVEAGGLRVAMSICWDLSHPVTVREATLAGADLILAPAAWRNPWESQYHLTCAARALDNGIYVVSANQLGDYLEAAFSASGGIYAPDGSRISTPDGVLSVGEIDPAFAIEWRASFGDALAASEYRDYSNRTSSGIA